MAEEAVEVSRALPVVRLARLVRQVHCDGRPLVEPDQPIGRRAEPVAVGDRQASSNPAQPGQRALDPGVPVPTGNRAEVDQPTARQEQLHAVGSAWHCGSRHSGQRACRRAARAVAAPAGTRRGVPRATMVAGHRRCGVAGGVWRGDHRLPVTAAPLNETRWRGLASRTTATAADRHAIVP